MYQTFEDVLPYEQFSVRLNNEDLPNIREILRGVTDAQYRYLLEGKACWTCWGCCACW